MKKPHIHNARTSIPKKLKLYMSDSIKFKGKRKKEFKCYDKNDMVATLSGQSNFVKKKTQLMPRKCDNFQ